MRLIYSAAAAAVLLLSASCTQTDTGIFAGIESEQKVVSLGGLSKYASVFSMAEDTSASPHVYYAAGGKSLFTRAANTTSWTASTVGGSGEVLAVGQAGTTVWAVAAGKLYKLTAGAWQVQTPSGGETVTNLVPVIGSDGITVDGQYVVTKTAAGSYSKIYRISSGGVLNSTAVDLQGAATTFNSTFTDLGRAITSAVAVDATHDIVANPSLLWDISGTTPTAYIPTGASNSEYSGLLYLGGSTRLFLSVSSTGTTGGGVYYASVTTGAASATFSAATNGTGLTFSSKAVSPAAMRWVAGSSSVWVGTASGNASYEGNGVLELSGTTVSVTPSTGLVTTSNYGSTLLSTYATPVIFQASDGTVFLGTAAHGLWKWDSSAKTFSQQ